MAGNNIHVNGTVDLQINARADTAKQQLADLQKQLKQVANIELNVSGESLTEEIQKASKAAIELSSHLTNATNINTGNLDFSKLQSSLKASKTDIQSYIDSLIALGPQGKKAFVSLANSIAQSEIPLKRTNKLLDTAFDNLKKTIGWQFSSSIVHGFMGSIQQAVGYAKDLDRSLTDIRIVTGASSDQMASFAKEANKAAKALNATTTDYTKASLIYYQQGLNEADVKARTETTIKMANVTGTTAQKVSEQMTAVWNNYDDGSKSLTYYADVMTALGAATASSTDEIAQGLQKFASISNTVGLSYEYASAALATITSTSRESADVVGNALKTLFSRIQGLQLGETLEDGTTLNKYSSALAKVGINIKDASGQMKDMDAILDEMGMTWQTLARDEKMALAQTVAGVRQYTQLMTLMENWNSFKTNVQIAEDSEGALDTQASIYAESWEAASNRVRTSWEGLWDNLINSDSFISVLDFFSGLIDMVDSLVTGLGGAGGVLATFGGVLTKTFSPQIAKSIKDAAYSLQMMMPGAMEKIGNERASIVKKMNDSLASGSFQIDSNESRVLQSNLTAMATESAMRDIRYANMTEQEKIAASLVESRLANIRADKQNVGSMMDQAQRDVDRFASDDSPYGKILQQAWSQTDINAANKRINEINQEIKTADKNKTKPASGKTFTDLKQERAQLQQQVRAAQESGTKKEIYDKAATAAANFDSQFNKAFWDNIGNNNNIVNTKEAKESMKQLLKKHPLLKFDESMIDDAFSKMTGSDNQNRHAIRKLVTTIIDDSFTNLSGTEVSPENQTNAKQYMEAMFRYAMGEETLASLNTADEEGQNYLRGFDKPKPDKMTGAIDAAQSAMFTLGLAQSATAAGEALVNLANNAGTVGDLFSALVGSAMNMVMGMSSISNSLMNLAPSFAQSTTSILGATMSNAGWIGLAITAVTAIASAIIGGLEAERQAQIERHEKTLEETDAAQERLDKNKDLVSSMTDSISAYETASSAFQQGTGSAEDQREARKALVTTIQESGEDYTPEVITQALLGDTKGAQEALYNERLMTIEQEEKKIESGANAAKELLFMQSGLDTSWGSDYATHTGRLTIDSGFIGGTADQLSTDAVTHLKNLIGYGQGISFGGSHIKFQDDMLTDPEKFIKYYDLIKSNMSALVEAGYGESDFYKNLESFITANAKNVEDYKEYQKKHADLQAEKAVLDNRFFEVDSLKEYNSKREALIQQYGATIPGFETSLDEYLNTLPNLINATAGNLPAIHKALQGVQEKTKRIDFDGMSMDGLIDIYNSMGNEIFSINFEAMSVDTLKELDALVKQMEAEGTPITLSAILQEGTISDDLKRIIQQAQLIADQNTIQISVEAVQSFNPEEDMYNAQKRSEFVKGYNELMGYEEGDDGYLTPEQMDFMTSDEITQLALQSSNKGITQLLDTATMRQQDQAILNAQAAEKLEIAKGKTEEVTGAFETTHSGEPVLANKAIQYAGAITEYNDLINRTDLTDSEVARRDALKETLVANGIAYSYNGALANFYQTNLDDIENIAKAQEEENQAQSEVTAGEQAMSSIESDIQNEQLRRQQLLAQEAEFYGIAADEVRAYAAELKRTQAVTQDVGETDAAYNTRLMKISLEYHKNSEGLAKLQTAYKNYKQAVNTKDQRAQLQYWNDMKSAISMITNMSFGDISDKMMETIKNSGLLEKALQGDAEAIQGIEDISREVQFLDPDSTFGDVVSTYFSGSIEAAKGFVAELNGVLAQTDMGQMISDVNAGTAETLSGLFTAMANAMGGGAEGVAAAAAAFNGLGIGVMPTTGADADVDLEQFGQVQGVEPDGNGGLKAGPVETIEGEVSGGGGATGLKFYDLGGGGGGAPSGGGGGGGGGPKKVANKRKSQTVKRYKKNDMRRSAAQSAKKSASTQKDYLYGESKIAQMEKINKLAAKEAAITSDRIRESRKYMIEDRENLIKYMQKYGYEAEFDSDGFLNNYEDAWGKIHDKIAKLYEDNELTDDEQKLEEDYKVELEELEGALEDYENSLKELQSDIEAYEESLYEMYDNKVEQMQHKVEFRIELNEDDLSYLDFWIEALGDSLYNALESLQTMGAKTNVLFDGISTYKQGIEDIYALSDDPFQAWATGGLDGVLTQDQVDALRENRDGLMDYMQQLLDLRQTMQDKVLDVFDKWQEKLSNTMSTIEHYGSVIEHFRNIMDVVGKDALGLDDQFMARFEQSAIDQSMDNIDATKAHYESLVSQNEEAQRRLAEARARGDKASEEHWQGVVDSTTEAMQSAQDSLLSSLESTLDMIASQFESAMTRAVEAFNDAIYEHGGLSGLSEDYSFMREQSDLMAQDYDKIYQLSKLNRNINKTLSDTNIIAGKQKMKSLQQEINELQASGVELSKYDLDYLQAKYELRLAEIELENAKNAKDTVRLSKDSEGNWSYIYTSSTDKVDEAQQKYEDALYAMQNLSYEYMEEMSNGMMQTSLAMMEKIQSLRIQDFDSYEAYAAEVKRIQDQYAGSLQNQQNELDKSMMNNQELYNQDWQAYSDMTGYKISAAQDWADNFSETTLGALMGSESSTSDFADTVFGLSNTLSNDLGTAAMSYFANVETAMNKYGTSINGFGSTVTTTVGNISTKSKTAANDMKTMAQEMNDAFTDITESVANWQKEFSGQIDSMLKEIGTLVQSINEAIQKSAEITGTKQVGDLIGSAEAAELLSGHEEYDFGDWKMDGSQLKVKGVGEDDYSATTFVEENAKLIDEINKKLLKYTEAKTGSEDRARLGEELEVLFKKYHAFKDIVSRVYDPTTLAALKLDNPNYASMDTGGYTGEWGDSGKFAMLHEKELVLNQDDTKNFLDALSISREVLHSMIEMNAKQSSLALGDLYPSSIQDMSQMLEQQVSITAEFPNATNRSDIEDAFNSLINTASQYANRYK